MVIKKLERRINSDLEHTVPVVKEFVKQLFPDLFAILPPTVEDKASQLQLTQADVCCDFCQKPMKEVSPGTFICNCR